MERRNSFENLILLCVPHHTTIDGSASDEYPVAVLASWKAAREGQSLEALQGLSGLTEARLGQMLAEAQGQFLDEVRPALTKFSKTAPELAQLLNTLLDELADPRVHGFGLSQDSIELFSSAARRLGSFEENVNVPAAAADNLGNLGDGATALGGVVGQIERATLAIRSAIDEMPHGRR
ncbi:hypothetical protein [Streptomyces sp. NPDC001980]|uniref:hypothetical protein n=1 Tax=Streptomyces sp. NPDC001980 TaxID=3157126 RepID=UPI0033338D20